jgi:ABC-type antimicrobial peptide transport system permease subunit
MWRDILSEALAAMLARLQRTALTALGTLVGTAALVAVAGLATTAGAQIVSRFDELAATTVTVMPAQRDSPQGVASPIPWDAGERLGRLNGVVAAGTMSSLDVGQVHIRANTVVDPLAPPEFSAPIVAGSPGLYQAVRGQIAAGRWFDDGHNDRGDPVVVLGRNVANQLNLAALRLQPAVFIGDRPFTVIGVLGEVARNDTLLNAVIVPDNVARRFFGLEAPTSVIVETRIGAAALIAKQAPVALAPQDPQSIVALRPPEPATTRSRVSGDVQALFVILGAVSLVIGAVGIANTTLVSVLERTGEIGLRRSLGGTRRSIAALFMIESTLTGLLGAVFGASFGVLIIIGVAATRHWAPVLDGWLPPLSVMLGGVIGLLAGVYPAWRATRIEPIAALRAQGS